MIDTHAHLDSCTGAVEDVLERSRAAGVTRIVTIGTGIDSCRAAVAIAEREEGVVAAVGIDPHRAATADAGRVDELRELLEHPRVVAVGETGLDNFHQHASPAEQRALFGLQLALAEETGKTVVIHSRDAAAETASMLASFTGTVVLHCFSSPELLAAALDRGYYVSFAGNVTFPRAGELRDAAALVPADRILLETDSPYLAPQPLRGSPNEPANLVHTLAVVADVRGETPAELAAHVDRNATRAFGLRLRG